MGEGSFVLKLADRALGFRRRARASTRRRCNVHQANWTPVQAPGSRGSAHPRRRFARRSPARGRPVSAATRSAGCARIVPTLDGAAADGPTTAASGRDQGRDWDGTTGRGLGRSAGARAGAGARARAGAGAGAGARRGRSRAVGARGRVRWLRSAARGSAPERAAAFDAPGVLRGLVRPRRSHTAGTLDGRDHGWMREP